MAAPAKAGAGDAGTPRCLFGLAAPDLLVEADSLLTHDVIPDERALHGEVDGARLFLT